MLYPGVSEWETMPGENRRMSACKQNPSKHICALALGLELEELAFLLDRVLLKIRLASFRGVRNSGVRLSPCHDRANAMVARGPVLRVLVSGPQ